LILPGKERKGMERERHCTAYTHRITYRHPIAVCGVGQQQQKKGKKTKPAIPSLYILFFHSIITIFYSFFSLFPVQFVFPSSHYYYYYYKK